MGDEERDDLPAEEEEKQTAEEAPSGSAFSRIIKILLYVGGGILLVALMIGISVIVSKNIQERSYEKSQDIVHAPPAPPLSTFPLDPAFTTTTSDSEPHFMKMEISLGYDKDPLLQKELGDRKDQMRHIVNILLKGKKYDELNSVNGATTLAEEIKAHINVILIDGKIKEVYFKDFTVQ